MRQRPVRSQIFLPLLRFGITDEDWGAVILSGVLGYCLPFALDLKLGGLPLELPSAVLSAGGATLFLNWLRRRSRPGWLRHRARAALGGQGERRLLPVDDVYLRKSFVRLRTARQAGRSGKE